MPIIVSGQEGDWLGWPCWLKGLIPMPMSEEPPKTLTQKILMNEFNNLKMLLTTLSYQTYMLSKK